MTVKKPLVIVDGQISELSDLDTIPSNSHIHSIYELSNVVITTPSVNDVILFDGTNFVNGHQSGGGYTREQNLAFASLKL